MNNFLIVIMIKVIINLKHFNFICTFFKAINFGTKLINLKLVKLLMTNQVLYHIFISLRIGSGLFNIVIN